MTHLNRHVWAYWTISSCWGDILIQF